MEVINFENHQHYRPNIMLTNKDQEIFLYVEIKAKKLEKALRQDAISQLNTYLEDIKQNIPYQLKFQVEMEKQINESMRDQSSGHAKSFLVHLEKAYIENTLLLNNIQNRLSDTINLLIENAEIINFSTSIIKEISEQIFLETETLAIKNDLMDNLILQCILSHAHQYPTEEKIFISGNTKDFGKQEIVKILSDTGIKYFSNTKNFIGWLNSQSS